MTVFTDEQLLEFNAMGLVPGPQENASTFFDRVHYCLRLKSELETIVGQEFPPSSDLSAETHDLLNKPLHRTAQFYGIEPRWIPLFFSNHQLTPWHGGCAWIFQAKEKSPIGAFLQLRRAFCNSPRYLGMYHRDELIAHEISHIGRMAFEEPKFEEFFAYNTSASSFRRWLGPIIQSPWESMLFVLVLLVIFLTDLSLISIGFEGLYRKVMWLKTIPLIMVTLACVRLWRRHRQFSRCLGNLKDILSNEATAMHILYRLTDAEIISFSSMTPENLQKEIHKKAKESLRWRLINLLRQMGLRPKPRQRGRPLCNPH